MKQVQMQSTVFKLSAICFSTWLAMGHISAANAAIVVDHQKSPGTSVTAASTGAAIVNINPASAGGVSHNTYTQFNVDGSGLILNNSAANSTTTLGGNIAGNSNMAGGSASVILNEVNSRNPSQLNGMIEVAGKQAAVVIANPSGITCDGCGFINASRSTLVTGTAEMVNGKLTGFDVNDGQVVITGKGMNDLNTGYTDILSRSVKINAQLQAQDLRIVTGSNHVDYNTLATREIRSELFSGTPSLALDVSSLGGMYANKIQLIGTEAGVGVRNNGTIAASDTLSLSNNGKLENNGLVQGANVHLDTRQHTLDNDHGSIEAAQALTIDSGNIDNNIDGAMVSNGSLVIDTHGQTLDNGGKGISGEGAVTINAGSLNNNSWIASNAALTLNTSGTLTNNGSLYAEDMTLSAPTIHNRGNIQAGNANIYASYTFDNTYGDVEAVHSLVANAQTVLNTGGILHSDEAVNIVTGKLDNSSEWYDNTTGGAVSGSDVIVKADLLDNDDGSFSGGNITLLGDTLDIANGQVSATGTITLNAAKNINISKYGWMESNNGSVEINAGNNFSSDGTIRALDDISIVARNISNNGQISADDTLSMYASDTIDNSKNGYVYGGNSFAAEAVNRIDNAGEFYSIGVSTIKSNTINIAHTGIVFSNDTHFYMNHFNNHGLVRGPYTYSKY